MEKVRKVLYYTVIIGIIYFGSVILWKGTKDIIFGSLNGENYQKIYRLIGILILGIAMTGMVFKFIKIMDNCSQRTRWIIRGGLCVFIFAMQLFFLNGMGEICLTRDSFKVVDMASNMVTDTNGTLDNTMNEPVYKGYFARYTNNQFITILFYYLFSIVDFFGGEDFILAARILNVILIDCGLILTFFTAKKLLGSKKADIGLLFMAISPTTYVWLFWSYTNTYSIPFTMGILLLALYARTIKNRGKQIACASAMGFLGAFGYLVRPTVIIPIIGIVFVILFFWKDWKKKMIYFTVIAGVFIVTFLGAKNICKTHLVDPQCKEGFPATHWIMMGLSDKGGYCAKDTVYTRCFPSKSEKIEANLEVIKDRIQEKGVRGCFKLATKKIYRVFGDGVDQYNQQAKTVENSTVAFSYVYGKNNGWMMLYAKVFRIFVWIFILMNMFMLLRQKMIAKSFLYMVTIFGAVLFFIIWEGNRKYSISFEYIMELLAAEGAILTYQLLERKTWIGNFVSSKLVSKIGTGLVTSCLVGAIILLPIEFRDATKSYRYNTNYIRIEEDGSKKVSMRKNGVTKMEQTFVANTEFDNLTLFVKEKNVNNKKGKKTKYKIEILKAQGEVCATTIIEKKQIKKGQKQIKLEFEKIVPKKKGEQYYITVERISKGMDFLDFKAKEYLSQDKFQIGTLYEDGKRTRKDLCFFVET